MSSRAPWEIPTVKIRNKHMPVERKFFDNTPLEYKITNAKVNPININVKLLLKLNFLFIFSIIILFK